MNFWSTVFPPFENVATRLKTFFLITLITSAIFVFVIVVVINRSTITTMIDTNYLLIVFTLFLWLILLAVIYFLLRERSQVKQLRFNTDRLETLLKNLPGMAYRCLNRKDWPMEFASEGCYALCGYDRRDLEEKRVLWGSTFTHPDEVKFVEETILSAVANDKPFEVEYRIITRDGKEKWVWERGRAVGIVNGDTILEGFITDINDRKLVETALVQAESYSKAVVNTAVEAVITVDDHGAIETVNRATQQMFGYVHEEIEGKNILFLISETFHEEYEQFIAHYLETNESSMIGMGSELTGIRKDKSTFPIHLSISEVRNQDEIKYVGLIRDLSIQRAAEKELREQRELLAHVDRLNTLSEMATVIAHEINQPLTAISMYAQSCLRFLDKDKFKHKRIHDALEKLSVQAHRAGAVIERVQQLSQQHESHSEKVHCNELIKDVHKLAEVEARIRDIVIKLKLSHLLPKVVCDPIQIQQVVLNLLRNGMESMKNISCENGNLIVLRTSRRDFGVKISVIDSGAGISDNIAEQLYKPFSSTKDSGMGMGLSISRSIVNAHGGQLEFSNNENGGVTFFFTLPYERSKKS